MVSAHEFVATYGTKGLTELVAKFIKLAPPFPGDQDLAKEIGTAFGDLESVLAAETAWPDPE